MVALRGLRITSPFGKSERNQAAHEGHDAAYDSVTFRLWKEPWIRWILGLQGPAIALSNPSLDRVLPAENRENDRARSELVIWIDDDNVAVQEMGTHHAVALCANGERSLPDTPRQM